MNVITVSRPPRKRNYHNSPSLNRTRRVRPRQDQKPEWQDMAEVLLFALIALISTWPLLAAVDAVVGLK
jgi:hypothetical protein